MKVYMYVYLYLYVCVYVYVCVCMSPRGGGHWSLGRFCPLAVTGARLGLLGAKPPTHLSRS